MSNAFTWEKEYKRTWLDTEKEDKNTVDLQTQTKNNKRKGILRHMHFLIDTSLSIDQNDYIPSIRTAVTKTIETFVSLFYVENPISGLSFSCVNEKGVKSTADNDIHGLLSQRGEGYFSLSNGLYGAIEQLRKYTFCKEIVVITSSLVLKDPDSYNEILDMLRRNNVKVSIISLCGELMIYKRIVEHTGGKLYVPMDCNHFNHIMKSLTIPSEIKTSTTSLVKLGFPKVIYESGVCACHLQCQQVGYECPVCKTYICTIPMGCPICGTQLVSSLNISKSFHHMYPLHTFNVTNNGLCIVCNNAATRICEKCDAKYCVECDNFIHDNLNFCIRCDACTAK